MLRIYSSLFVISFIVLVLACEKPRQRSTDVPDPERLERYAIEREEAIKRWENRLAKLRSQKGNDDTWEPREAPSALPRGEVAKLPEGIEFVVRSTFRPDRVVANYQDVLYWIEGISTEGVWSDTRFQIEALVEYIEDREYNGMMIRVIRCYSTGEPFIETFDVTSPNGKPGGKTVHVKGYTRKDGTAVQSHDRRPQGGRR